MPPDWVDALPASYVEARLVARTSEIYSRLRKRYKVPFVDPVPEIAAGWLTSLVQVDLYQRRGWDPSDEHAQAVLQEAATAREQMQEAADAQNGLYDLPLNDAEDATAITKGAPFGYSEADPYTWMDRQREAADVFRW